jgi:hypothetical protein
MSCDWSSHDDLTGLRGDSGQSFLRLKSSPLPNCVNRALLLHHCPPQHVVTWINAQAKGNPKMCSKEKRQHIIWIYICKGELTPPQCFNIAASNQVLCKSVCNQLTTSLSNLQASLNGSPYFYSNNVAATLASTSSSILGPSLKSKKLFIPSNRFKM